MLSLRLKNGSMAFSVNLSIKEELHIFSLVCKNIFLFRNGALEDEQLKAGIKSGSLMCLVKSFLAITLT
jgi:hypothetical protein